MTDAVLPGGLTYRESAFVLHFANQNFQNATQAAILAGYSPRTANPASSRLLARVKVQAAIEEAREAKEAQLHLTPERTTLELARVGYGDATSLYEEVDGKKRLKPFSELTADQKAMIAGIEQRTVTTYAKDGTVAFTTTDLKVRVNSKIEALKTLAHIQGLTPQGNRSITVNDNRSLSMTLQPLLQGLTTEELRETLAALRQERIPSPATTRKRTPS